MPSTVFSTSSESFPVAHIIYAGYIIEIPTEKRKNNQTHFFKILTTTGPSYCYFNSFETAKKTRNLLGLMMCQIKPSVFKSGNDIIDASRIVSFTKVLALKRPENGFTHALLLTLDTISTEKSAQVWLHYKSEESAHNARKALFATILALHSNVQKSESDSEQETANMNSINAL